MTREEFIEHIGTILYHEGWQCKRGRTVKGSVKCQQKAINTIAQSLDIEKLTENEVIEQSFG